MAIFFYKWEEDVWTLFLLWEGIFRFMLNWTCLDYGAHPDSHFAFVLWSGSQATREARLNNLDKLLVVQKLDDDDIIKSNSFAWQHYSQRCLVCNNITDCELLHKSCVSLCLLQNYGVAVKDHGWDIIDSKSCCFWEIMLLLWYNWYCCDEILI